MSENFVYSDEDCCNKCRQMYYDLYTHHHFCRVNRKPVEPYNPACDKMDRILQGFGE